MITSISDISVYKRCRRRWDYSSSHRGNLTSVGIKSPALELGTLIHAALADWTLDPTHAPDVYFAAHAIRRIEEINAHYLQIVGAPPDDIEIAPLMESIALGIDMCKNYKTRWKRPLDANFIFAVPEQEIIVDIPGTEHPCICCTSATIFTTWPACKECNDTGIVVHKLRMILDGLIQDKNGTYLVLERKTYERTPSEDLLQNNDQFMGYTWGATQIKELGKVGGVAYDGLWKRKAPPRGRTFEDLFVRKIVRFTQAELLDWQHQLAAVVNEMASNPTIYPNRRWEGCSDCTFLKLCNAESKGEDIEYMKQHMYEQRPNNRPILTVLT